MIRHLVIATLSASLFLGGERALGAQERITSPYRYIEENHSVGAFAGYLWTQSLDPDLGPQPAPLFGIRYSIRLGGPVSGEAALGMIPAERTVFAARGVDPQDPTRTVPEAQGTANMPLLLAEAGVRLSITGPRTWHGLAPYLVATGGLVADLVRGTALDEEVPEDERFRFGPGFAVGAGVGTEWFVTRRFSLRGEVRDQIWRIAIPGGLTETGQQVNQWTNNLGLSLGAALHF